MSNALDPVTVLVVDDDTDQRTMLKEALGISGFTVLTAADGQSALEQLRQYRADVVVTDYHMPGMTGSELICAIRQEFPGLPVILSGTPNNSASTAEADEFLPKPISLQKLEEAILRLSR